MPIVNGNYVAPTWVDNAPPAIDAEELQAICDALVQTNSLAQEAQNTANEVQSDLNNISVTGLFSVQRNGTVQTKTVTLGFKPRLVLIYSDLNGTAIPVRAFQQNSIAGIRIITGATSANDASITSNGFTASFYGGNYNDQTTVYYIAFK